MRNCFKILIVIIISTFIQLKYMNEWNINNELINSFITFLSIVFGFYITSLTVFSTSKFASKLYKIIDKKRREFSLLNTLVNNYETGLIIILLSIMYLLLIQFSISQTDEKEITLSNKLSYPFLGLVIINFWYSYKLLKDLIKITLQEAKNSD